MAAGLVSVRIVASTDMPGRSRPASGLSGSSRSLTGMRCTTLVKLPVALSGGSRLNCDPLAGEMLSEVDPEFGTGGLIGAGTVSSC